MMETTTRAGQVPDIRVFKGPAYQQMPKLSAEGFVLASAAQIMRYWLEGKLRQDLHHDSGDAVVCHPDGSVKLAYDSEDLRRLHPEGRLSSSGALVLPDDAWESIDGKVLSKEEIATSTGRRQSKESAKNDFFLLWLARDDRVLLHEYVDAMFGRVKERVGRDTAAMGVFVRKDSAVYTPVLRLWRFGGIDNYSRGDAIGDGRLDHHDDGRLVGIRETPYVASPENQGLPEAMPREAISLVLVPKEKIARRDSTSQHPVQNKGMPYHHGPSLEETLAVVLPTAKKYTADILHKYLQRDLTRQLSELYERHRNK